MLLSTVDRSLVEERLDPAFYAPEALAVEAWLDRQGEAASEGLGTLVEFVASAFYEGLAERYKLHGTSLVRVGDVRLGTVATDRAVFLDDAVATSTDGLRTVSHPCLVLTKGGSVGRVGVTSEKGTYALSRDVIGLRPRSGEDIGRLLFFLASAPGRTQVLRGASRQVQAHLTLGRLESLRVPTLSEAETARLTTAYDELRNARGRFAQRRRDLNDLFATTDPFAQLEEPRLSYSVDRSDALRARMDVAYYRPGFAAAAAAAAAGGWVRLASLDGISFEAPTWDRAHAVPSDHILYVPLAGIEPFTCRIVRPMRQRVWRTPARAKWIIRAGDVLVPSLLDCLDRVGYVDATDVGAVASSGFHLIRPSDAAEGLCIAAYLTSNGAQQQILRAGSGTRFRSINPDLLLDLLVPPRDSHVTAQLPQIMTNLRDAAEHLQDTWHRGISLAEEIVGWGGASSVDEDELDDLEEGAADAGRAAARTGADGASGPTLARYLGA